MQGIRLSKGAITAIIVAGALAWWLALNSECLFAF